MQQLDNNGSDAWLHCIYVVWGLHFLKVESNMEAFLWQRTTRNALYNQSPTVLQSSQSPPLNFPIFTYFHNFRMPNLDWTNQTGGSHLTCA